MRCLVQQRETCSRYCHIYFQFFCIASIFSHSFSVTYRTSLMAMMPTSSIWWSTSSTQSGCCSTSTTPPSNSPRSSRLPFYAARTGWSRSSMKSTRWYAGPSLSSCPLIQRKKLNNQQAQPSFSRSSRLCSFSLMSVSDFMAGDIPELFLGCGFTPSAPSSSGFIRPWSIPFSTTRPISRKGWSLFYPVRAEVQKQFLIPFVFMKSWMDYSDTSRSDFRSDLFPIRHSRSLLWEFVLTSRSQWASDQKEVSDVRSKTSSAAIDPRQQARVIERNDYWPAVSQTWTLIFLSQMGTTFAPNYTPSVGSCSFLKRDSRKRSRRQLLPTPRW